MSILLLTNNSVTNIILNEINFGTIFFDTKRTDDVDHLD